MRIQRTGFLRGALVYALIAVSGAGANAREVSTLNISNAVRLALLNNLTLAQYEKDAAIADAQYAQSFADFALPDAALSGSWTVIDPDTVDSGIVDGMKFLYNTNVMGLDIPVMESVKLTNAYWDNYSAGLTVTKPLFSGFRLWNAMAIRKNALDLARARLRDKKSEVETTVRTSFYDLFLIRENVRLAEDLDASLQERLKFTRANYQAGIVSEYDLIKADVQWKNNQPRLSRVRNAYVTSKMAFCNLIGISDPGAVELAGSLLDTTNETVPAITADRAVNLAVSNDIGIRTLDYTLDNLRLSREVSAAGSYPTLSAFFNAKLDWKKRSTYDADRQWIGSWNTGLQLSVPIDDWIPLSRTAQTVRETEETLAKTELARRQAVDGVSLQVRALLLQIEESDQTIRSQSENVRQARTALGMMNVRYRAGNASSLEVTDAEVSYNQAQTSYLQALLDHYTAALKLKRMTGS